ncbi:4Fe-4S dicluster domain-containing protein [Tepidibacter aestuarii]|uniref:4Fe-4S dicluster domain-containing protein n=1 Tax=Tepidibacter aestuarii TaxID=2925782 RepID=UPI0020C10A0A|nr:4Fe-4S dicluster-binding protein [Tepidibacter aestuarii]CAH2214604.1 adenylylsulfate reductase, subunit B [Tepidibacter aestuarii]
MSIRINRNKCISCSKCEKVCPGNLIQMNDKRKAEIKYKDQCWGCTACLKECGQKAIEFYLGEDIGGRGSYLTARVNETEVEWTITSPNDKKHVIVVNRKDANKY